jgi:hypothetical protein
MEAFLATIARTLRHLKIQNLRVPLAEGQHSFDEFYTCFQERLDLETVTLLGIWYIHRLNDPDMYVADMSEPCVKDLQQWLLSKNHMPLSAVAPKVVLVDIHEANSEDSSDDGWRDRLVPVNDTDDDDDDDSQWGGLSDYF